MKTPTKPIVVAVSGGFDPLHVGHLEMFRKAKKLGDRLVVILNNDNWLLTKKKYVFMSQKDRKKILESLIYVDQVLITNHAPYSTDTSVCSELEKLRPHIFANGGDRKSHNTPEDELCRRLGIKRVYNLGKKIQSSSALVKAAKIKS